MPRSWKPPSRCSRARGYHPSSIDEIAQAAGISKALIYEHFASKEELHVSLIEMYAGELFERVAAAGAPGPDAAERLEAGLDAVFAFVEERRGAWQMLFRETADPETAAVLDARERWAWRRSSPS